MCIGREEIDQNGLLFGIGTGTRRGRDRERDLVTSVEEAAVEQSLGDSELPVQLWQLLGGHCSLPFHDVARHSRSLFLTSSLELLGGLC